MGIVTIRCPMTGEEVSTGVVIDAAGFAVIKFHGHQFRCDACGKVHTWDKKGATYRPSVGGLDSRPPCQWEKWLKG
jgi:hypothetical protein